MNIYELCNSRNYLNKDIDCLLNTYIREYDMKSAGLNVLYREKLIDEVEYNYLKTIPKKELNIRIGLLQRGNKSMAEGLSKGLAKVRAEFMEANNLTEDDILSIKNDAIFVINKSCRVLQFDNIIFSNKNTYTSYYYLDGKEFYYIKNRGQDILHVKGIEDSILERHKDYMVKTLCEIFRSVEIGTPKNTFNKLKRFAFDYKELRLDIGYYREFTSSSVFRTKYNLMGKDIGLKEYDGDIEDLIISYNYRSVILELINLIA